MQQVSSDVNTRVDYLVVALRKGDSGAFQELMRRESSWVRGAVYAVLGTSDGLDDVVQDVWLLVWQRAERLECVEKWRSWLFRLARNAAIDSLRKKKRRGRMIEAMKSVLLTSCKTAPPPEQSLASSEESKKVLLAIENLAEIYRQPFVLRHIENWTYREIADALDLHIDTVETRLVRARKQLRAVLRRREAGSRY